MVFNDASPPRTCRTASLCGAGCRVRAAATKRGQVASYAAGSLVGRYWVQRVSCFLESTASTRSFAETVGIAVSAVCRAVTASASFPKCL